jgi:hypothetical protein
MHAAPQQAVHKGSLTSQRVYTIAATSKSKLSNVASVQVIGAHLRRTRNWEEFVNSSRGAIATADHTKVIQAICKPSYSALPMPLKRAFVSFAAYANGARVSGEELVSLWGALALVPDARAYVRAREQLKQLEAAQLVKRTEYWDQYLRRRAEYFMHDILRDMAAACAQADFSSCLFSFEQVRLQCLRSSCNGRNDTVHDRSACFCTCRCDHH